MVLEAGTAVPRGLAASSIKATRTRCPRMLNYRISRCLMQSLHMLGNACHSILSPPLFKQWLLSALGSHFLNVSCGVLAEQKDQPKLQVKTYKDPRLRDWWIICKTRSPWTSFCLYMKTLQQDCWQSAEGQQSWMSIVQVRQMQTPCHMLSQIGTHLASKGIQNSFWRLHGHRTSNNTFILCFLKPFVWH